MRWLRPVKEIQLSTKYNSLAEQEKEEEEVQELTECVVEALKICQKCNCVQFNNRYYLPCRGCAMGPSHACDLTDTWIGPIAKKHVETCPVETCDFSIYRDDGLEILLNKDDLQTYLDHLASLHLNVKWETKSGREGQYLDLHLMIVDGKIESRVFTKSAPIYLPPNSCHDRSVYKGLYKGVGLRLRLNCSRDEDFDKAVEEYSKAFAISGHNYQQARSELMACKKINREHYLNKNDTGAAIPNRVS